MIQDLIPKSPGPNSGISPWPPELGKPYPDLTLVNGDGEYVKLSSFKGKVLIIEPVGMTCLACQAYSGAAKHGSYSSIGFQGGTLSIEEYFPQYSGGIKLSDDRLVFIQILLYSLSMDAPTASDAREWAKHFKLDQRKNYYVLAGTPDLIGKTAYDLIPGLQLVDRDFILRYDAAGHRPKHNMWSELMAGVRSVID